MSADEDDDQKQPAKEHPSVPAKPKEPTQFEQVKEGAEPKRFGSRAT